ncbi:hypothetical protein [Streptomyces cylindrosporus]|uniref:Uncharacterized protein n=1 Tax=Streptomyces cylindrosporus TaxID=2927583 RepID=A0ABS9YPJ1_9ACTN|nr:hypothetical protein [Streptomyces cylindrosporus]MCI3279154.1 hypothetical protein [Streptomyces cylindrosporus]
MNKRNAAPAVLPRLTSTQLAQFLAAEERATQDPDTVRPDCTVCGAPVTGWVVGLGMEHEDERVVTVQPCRHQATYSVKVAEVVAANVRAQAAAEATDLDKTRVYLMPVARLELADEPDVTHLALYSWCEPVKEWTHGMGICGRSTTQGALPDDTEVTCPGCLKWKPVYDQILAQRNQKEASR